MTRISFRALTPAELVVDAVSTEAERVLVVAHSKARYAACPICVQMSGKVHSRYERHLLDLPAFGRSMYLRLQVNRFRCGNVTCPRRIFGEPLAAEVALRAARRTSRLEGIVHHLGLALGGRLAAVLARRRMLPVSKDTLLRVVRRRAKSVGGASLTAAQLSMLLEGIDWRMPVRSWRPEMAG